MSWLGAVLFLLTQSMVQSQDMGTTVSFGQIEVSCDQLKNMHHAVARARVAYHCEDNPATGGNIFLFLAAQAALYLPLSVLFVNCDITSSTLSHTKHCHTQFTMLQTRIRKVINNTIGVNHATSLSTV